jgi:hypothetical protein
LNALRREGFGDGASFRGVRRSRRV